MEGASNRKLIEGILAAWTGEPDRALDLLGRSPADAPGAWEAEFYSGVALHSKKEYAAAIERMSRYRVRDRAITLPVWTLAIIDLAEATRDRADARRLLERALTSAREITARQGRELEARARRLLDR